MNHRPKYNNKTVRNSYGYFQSVGEFKRYLYLLDQEKNGFIQGLKRQVRYPLAVRTEHICDYIADFVYMKDGKEIVEDFKGFETDIFKIKKKLMKAVHKITLLITKSPTA